jgi:radical SAM superfamily enzyme YgiQ (UPF0313 family)
MKIALISPKGPLYRHTGGVFKKSLRYQPLTLTTLAALIPPELAPELRLIDEGIADMPADLEADLVGITVITGTAKRAYALADALRSRGITVVLGGPHVTLLPQEAAEHADAICTGYAEQSWPRLLRDFAAGRLQKVYRQGDDLSLENMPFARRDLFDRRDFLTQAVFEATRSCAHDCEFCVAPTAWGQKQYRKPIDWVIADIRQFVAKTGQRRILFVDLNLVSDKRYARELFTGLVELNVQLNVQWFGLSTVLIGHDRSLMELMARSGCKGLLLGLETVTPSSLQDANKRFNSSIDYRGLIADLHHLGIAVQGCFVFGLDHDTLDVFDATVQFAIDAAVDLPRFTVLTPFPGTPLFHRLEAEGRILTRDWELYDGQHVVFQPRNMSARQLSEGHERAWKQVYRLGAIGKRLWQAGSLNALGIASNLGYRFYAHRLHRFYTCDWPMDTRWSLPWQRGVARVMPILPEHRSA